MYIARFYSLLTLVLLISPITIWAGKPAPVPNALYAEIHGIPNPHLCTRVYCGGTDVTVVHGKFKSYMCRKKGPYIFFFDADNNWLRTEPIVLDEMRDYDSLVALTRNRLLELPNVFYADVVTLKAGFQSIELYDQDGHRIARTEFGAYGAVQENNPIPNPAIEELASFVANPELLKNIRVRYSYSINLFTGKRVRMPKKV